MVSITATKIRDNSRDPSSVVGLGRAFQGFLISYPTVGRGMVIFREPTGHRMVTTPVRRVLGEFGEPLNIQALAEDLIILSGLVPGEDIQLRYDFPTVADADLSFSLDYTTTSTPSLSIVSSLT